MKEYSKFYHKIRLKSNSTNPLIQHLAANPSELSHYYPELLSTSWITYYNKILALFFFTYFCAEIWSSFRLGIRAPYLYARNFFSLFGSIVFAFRSFNLLVTTPGFFWGVYA